MMRNTIDTATQFATEPFKKVPGDSHAGQFGYATVVIAIVIVFSGFSIMKVSFAAGFYALSLVALFFERRGFNLGPT